MSTRMQLLAGSVLAAVMVSFATSTGDAPPTSPQAAPDGALIARGDSVFHGRLGGAICATCHGQDAKGLAGMGPDLTDAAWLHGDGSLPFLEAVIRAGVPKPKKSAVVMPPFGGVPLDSGKVRAVAAYVQALGARK